MVRLKTGHVWLALTALALAAARPAAARPRPVPGNDPTITVDESGNGIGTIGPGFLAADPLNSGVPVLTYILPSPVIQGDVLLTDADLGGAPGDVIRFPGDGTLRFYSDSADGIDALADTATPPPDTQENTVSIDEVGPEGFNGAVYTPMEGDPGWNSSNPTYHFISDTPEPGSLALLATGGLPLLGMLRRRRAA